MKTRHMVAGLIAATVVAAAGIGVYNMFYGKGAVCEETGLYVWPESGYERVTDSLAGKLKYPRAFGLYARHIGLPATVKAGYYRLSPEMSTVEVARMLKLGLQTPVRVSINNVRIMPQLASKLAAQIAADSTQIMAALTDPQLTREVGFDSLTLFSMFLPDTYEFYWTVKPEDFVRRMRREYDNFWTADRDARRSRTGLSRLGVMTLASIVYEESRQEDEFRRIAGVYMNRLRRGMPLQADPTVKYAMQDFGLRRILNRHLKYPSPYNTYINKGLPPSPIAMPSKATIDAVLDFEQHDYLYFCARPTFDGHHNFARTYSEHLANARAYTRELDKRKIK